MDYNNVASLLHEYNHFIIEEDWEKSRKDHPDFPQLNAFSDIFNQYAIDNYIAQVPLDLFDELPHAFIGLVTQNENIETVLIKKLNDEDVKLISFDKSITIDKSKFLNIWNGYILVIEENENPVNISSQKKNFNFFSILLIGILFVSIFLSNYFFNFLNVASESLIILNSLGFFLSYLAIKESFGFGNKHLFRVCSAIKNGNCNQVIKSTNANLLYNITYSDLSFVFYIYSFISSFFISKFPLLLSLNILFIPFSLITIILSILQQKFNIKKWCILCLGISLVTLFQSIVLFLISNYKLNINLEYSILSFFVFITIFTVWFFFKPLLVNYSELIFEKYQRGEIYKDKEVFNLYFRKNTVIPENDFSMLTLIKLNEANSSFNLVLVLSLSCEYCKSEYKKFRELMFYYDKKVNFIIVFNFNIDEIDNEMISVAENLYLLKDNPKIGTKAMDDFFIKNKSPNEWLQKWKQTSNSKLNFTHNNIEILNKNNISDTPCILINNRLYPKEYKIEDIKYFLNSIINTETIN